MSSGRPNRVAPDGTFHAVAERGATFGNRGALLGARGTLVRPFQGSRWIACVLEFRGRSRTQWQRGRYTELYFLDEATALAAGHRPCAECRRPAFERYRQAWRAAFDLAAPPRATEIDAALHVDRLVEGGQHRTFEAELADLPRGTVIEHDGGWWLVDGPQLRRWSFGGYGETRDRSSVAGRVTVLTPSATVAVLLAGYEPGIDANADP